MSFANKVVIVTGGSSGIGAATVVKFAEEGAKVVIVGRNEEKLKKVTQNCRLLNSDYHVIKADITKESEIKNVVDETVKKYGKIDIVINNAGIFRLCSIMDEKLLEIYDEVMNTNLKSIIILTASVAPHLIRSKGNIVNISSVAGSRINRSHFATYAISKAGVNMFTAGTAIELAPHGVRVNSVSPGPVRTDIVDNAGLNVNIQDWKNYTALGRISDSEEVADLILFIASDKAKGITGSNYVCDNGVLMYNG